MCYLNVAQLCTIKFIEMKIIITGSLGNISKPLTQKLVQEGHQVTVISSSDDKKAEIESLSSRSNWLCRRCRFFDPNFYRRRRGLLYDPARQLF